MDEYGPVGGNLGQPLRCLLRRDIDRSLEMSLFELAGGTGVDDDRPAVL